MKRISFAVAALALLPVVASATPNINSGVVVPRVFNDCPGSVFTQENFYPGRITLRDDNPLCFGGINLHNWRFSTDGSSAAQFANGDAFRFCSDVTIRGTGGAEAGLNITPWWSVSDGRLNVKVRPGDPTNGEVAAFGGRLPFYS